MKVVHSSFFRALCAIIVGALLIQYREQMVTWITIAIGVLFFLSGVISIATYFSAKRNASKVGIVYDANGKQISGGSVDAVYQSRHGSQNGWGRFRLLDIPFHYPLGGFACHHQAVSHRFSTTLYHRLDNAHLWSGGVHQCLQACQ